MISHCTLCGDETITKCDKCNTSINGYPNEEYGFAQKYVVPMYCHECGAPYPWMEKQITKVKQLIELSDEIDSGEKDALLQTVLDISIESPTSTIDANIFLKLTSKVGKFLKDALYKFAVDAASETAKKIIFPK